MEPNSPKKIQFAVPPFQSHLDPQAAEHIRKRRPTPATLVIYNDPSASDDKQSTSSQGETQSVQLSSAQRKTSVYSPPTMRGRASSDTQQAGQEESTKPPRRPQRAGQEESAHSPMRPQRAGQEESAHSPRRPQRAGQEESAHSPRRPQSPLATLSEEPAHVPPRRKDTPYQHQAPFTAAGVKTAQGQVGSSSAFAEDEEELQ